MQERRGVHNNFQLLSHPSLSEIFAVAVGMKELAILFDKLVALSNDHLAELTRGTDTALGFCLFVLLVAVLAQNSSPLPKEICAQNMSTLCTSEAG